MGPFERKRGPSWWHIAAVGMLQVQLGQAQMDSLSCMSDSQNNAITYPDYESITGKIPAAGFMAAPVRSFLHTVQPRPFPQELVEEIFNDTQKIMSDQAFQQKVLQYEMGFLVCAAIGILFIALMPIVGVLLACCRCCGKCGGTMYQEQAGNMQCRRRSLYSCTVFITVIIFAGNVCMYRSNQAMRRSMESGVKDVNLSMANILMFITHVPEQTQSIVDESHNVVDAVIGNVDGIQSTLGSSIQTSMNDIVKPVLDSVEEVKTETNAIEENVSKLGDMLNKLKSNMDQRQKKLDEIKANLQACAQCGDVTADLTLSSTIDTSSLSEFEAELQKVDLSPVTQKVNNELDQIPQTVKAKTADIVKELKNQLESIPNLSFDVDPPFLSSVSNTVEKVSAELDKVMPVVHKAEKIRWKVCIALCLVVLLIVACSALGLVLGPVGLQKSDDPTKRSNTSNTGGTLLMLSAGFSFLFSWVLMIIVLVLFILGGNVHTFLCRPWSDGELLKFIDSLDLLPPLGLATAPKDEISFSGIYSDCQKNQTMWSVLHFDQVVDLDKELNITRFTSSINQELAKLNIALPDWTLMEAADKEKLKDITKTRDFSSVNNQITVISEGFSRLDTAVEKLEKIAEAEGDPRIKAVIEAQIEELKSVQSDIKNTDVPLVNKVETAIADLEKSVERLSNFVTDLLRIVDEKQTLIKDPSTVVRNEIQMFTDCQIHYFKDYITWVKLALKEQVGQCGPVANAVDSMEEVLCANITESLNAFWFSLGWCTIFLIPSIILTIKLAKYYRRMKYSDLYDE